jgi:DNA-binding GntR family transcriptional regulator
VPRRILYRGRASSDGRASLSTSQIDMSAFEPVESPSLVERVARELRAAIVEGRLQPGERLSDVHLGEALGVSRGPVREAIRKLAATGLIREEARRGAYVADVDRATVHHVYDGRRALEGFAAATLARSAQHEAAGERLVAAAEGMRAASLAGKPAILAADLEFHGLLLRLVGNPWLDRLHGVLADQMQLMMAVDGAAWSRADPQEMTRRHRPIGDAIVAGDPDGAVAAVLRHLDDAEREFAGRHVQRPA